ncbi:MAG: isochorismatase family protein [Phycisphaerae bacterium]|nr:isochorismatase family protein [Phycisphaerae bacterium]
MNATPLFVSIAMVLLITAVPLSAGGGDPKLDLTLTSRSVDSSGGVTAVRKSVAWDAKKTAAIVCDMWDKHWCKGATSRVGEMTPRMNALLAAARDKGVLIIHAPSACMGFYKDHAARKRAQSAPKAGDAPKFLSRWASKLDTEKNAAWPVDQSDGGCDCQPRCKSRRAWKSQVAGIEISDADAITDSGVETWNLLAARGIDNVLVMGVHTNMCVIGRPFGLRNLKRAGKNVVLVRDLTDTMYNSRKSPNVSHFRGTELVVEYIEQYVCPTVVSTDILGGAAQAFAKDRRPHVVFLLGEREYKTGATLPAFAEAHLAAKGLRCTFIHAAAHSGKGRNEFPGFDAVKTADLLFVSVRRRALKRAQLDMIRAHLKAGKPLVGIRTASHAFDTRGKGPKGHADWADFDPTVLGGNYKGHHGGGGPATKVTLAAGAGDHAILAGVKAFAGSGSLYKVRPLAKTATPLLTGTIPNADAEPVAWTNARGKSRIFYTSLGHVEDFKDASFVRLLTNAVSWALDRPAPK